MVRKVLAFGPALVGKTCLLYRFRKNDFMDSSVSIDGKRNILWFTPSDIEFII
jgi:GTPase SAR1 family protein